MSWRLRRGLGDNSLARRTSLQVSCRNIPVTLIDLGRVLSEMVCLRKLLCDYPYSRSEELHSAVFV